MSSSGLSHATRNYPYFDWLRIVLASLVFWEHANVTDLLHVGNFAVQVFFALSGWLIGGILLETRPAGLPRFFFNRVTRIWFPYFAAVAALYLVAAAKEGFAPSYFQTLAYDLTFTHNWFIEKIPSVIREMPMQGTGSHFWSIAVEEQFYLFAPLLLVLLPGGRHLAVWCLVAALAILSGGWYGSVAGGVLAIAVQRKVGDWHLTGAGQWALWLGLFLVTGLYWGGIVGYGHFAPFAAVAIVLLAARPGKRTAIGQFFGGISYPMYLHHWMGLFAGNALLGLLPFIGRLPAQTFGFVFALAVAAVAYVLIDRNVLRYRAAWYSETRGRVAAAAAYSLLFLGILLGRVLIGPLDGA